MHFMIHFWLVRFTGIWFIIWPLKWYIYVIHLKWLKSYPLSIQSGTKKSSFDLDLVVCLLKFSTKIHYLVLMNEAPLSYYQLLKFNVQWFVLLDWHIEYNNLFDTRWHCRYCLDSLLAIEFYVALVLSIFYEKWYWLTH